MRKKHLAGILIVVSILLFNGCSAFKFLRVGEESDIALKRELEKKFNKRKFEDYLLIENSSIKISGEKNNRAKFLFYCEQGERIFASVKFVGFEIARFQITNDSVKYINRLNRTYFFGDTKKLENLLSKEVNLKNIQKFIYTGFLEIGKNGFQEFYKGIDIEEDSLRYSYAPDVGQKFISVYGKDKLKISSLFYFDYVKQIETTANFERDNIELNKIAGFVKVNGDQKEFEIKLGEISNKAYKKTKFRIGRNYEELDSIF